MASQRELDRLLTPAEVGAYLGIPVGTLANWRYLGRGPAFLRIGRYVRYRQSALVAWTASLDRHERSGEGAGIR
ncbi:MAG: helix-turn-helix transcriptional regulator [Acidimicrobiales bacterium]